MPASKILIVEDDYKIASVLQDYLHASAYLTEHVANGLDAVSAMRQGGFSLLLLDLMLPGLDGVQVCQAVRQFSSIPIIMLTARVEEIDKLIGLDAGADDYVCKPFSPREVVARVNAQLRRSGMHAVALPESRSVFVVDADKMLILVRGLALTLTPAEFRILAELIRHPGRVYSRQQLLTISSDELRDSSDRTVDSHIKNIRKKITERLPELDCLQSVYGVGYRFEMAT
ncbi:response regulator [Undibacterium sp. Rencai35W]|uniref:response regulator n=1 Tax=Undibacterium sp. Rencai35W TaxID=3413046 RepID=UPI003BF27B78